MGRRTKGLVRDNVSHPHRRGPEQGRVESLQDTTGHNTNATTPPLADDSPADSLRTLTTDALRWRLGVTLLRRLTRRRLRLLLSGGGSTSLGGGMFSLPLPHPRLDGPGVPSGLDPPFAGGGALPPLPATASLIWPRVADGDAETGTADMLAARVRMPLLLRVPIDELGPATPIRTSGDAMLPVVEEFAPRLGVRKSADADDGRIRLGDADDSEMRVRGVRVAAAEAVRCAVGVDGGAFSPSRSAIADPVHGVAFAFELASAAAAARRAGERRGMARRGGVWRCVAAESDAGGVAVSSRRCWASSASLSAAAAERVRFVGGAMIQDGGGDKGRDGE